MGTQLPRYMQETIQETLKKHKLATITQDIKQQMLIHSVMNNQVSRANHTVYFQITIGSVFHVRGQIQVSSF